MKPPGGRKTTYVGTALKRSFTLNRAVVERLEARADGNVSATANRLLEQALDREDALEGIRDLARQMGTDLDPEIQARAREYLLDVILKAERSRADQP